MATDEYGNAPTCPNCGEELEHCCSRSRLSVDATDAEENETRLAAVQAECRRCSGAYEYPQLRKERAARLRAAQVYRTLTDDELGVLADEVHYEASATFSVEQLGGDRVAAAIQAEHIQPGMADALRRAVNAGPPPKLPALAVATRVALDAVHEAMRPPPTFRRDPEHELRDWAAILASNWSPDIPIAELSPKFWEAVAEIVDASCQIEEDE